MKRIIYVVMIISFFYGYESSAQSKWLKKAKEKLEKKGDKAVDGILNGKKKKKENSNSDNSSTPNGSTSGSNSSNTSDRRGGRPGERDNTPPPIDQSISEAKSAIQSSDYAGARFSIEQALWAIEYELGKEILAEMPTSINGSNYNESKDYTGSAGFGLEGFAIKRTYEGGETETYVQVIKDAPYEEFSLILSNPRLYANSDNNYKIIQVNDFKAVIEYTDNGYEIGIPFGQSSVFHLEAVNYENEQAVIDAAGKFDISRFKELLGEQ